MLIEIIETSFDRHFAELKLVRQEVFVFEQSVPESLEADDRDSLCQHLLALSEGEPVGTARVDWEKQGKVGRVAVRKPWRGLGLGKRLMQRLESLARDRDVEFLWLHAQRDVIPFYESLGYVNEGSEFMEAGIPHQKMRKQIGDY